MVFRLVATQKVDVYLPSGTISFADMKINKEFYYNETGNAFTVRYDGTYIFMMDVHIGKGKESGISSYVNGKQKYRSYETYQETTSGHFSKTWFLELKQNDKVDIRNNYANTIQHTSSYPMQYLVMYVPINV